MPVNSKPAKASAARKKAAAGKATKKQPKATKKQSRPAKTVAAAKPRAKKATAEKTTAKATAAKKTSVRDASPVVRLRELCMALPETTEVEAWGAPTFRVKGKIFVMYAAEGGHSDRPAAWILSVSLEQDMMMRLRPDRYFKPPYVGPSGWVGAYLDKSPPWKEIEELIREGWRRRAPKKIAALLGD